MTKVSIISPVFYKTLRQIELCTSKISNLEISNNVVKSTKLKGIFWLFAESGWRYALMGAELGYVLLTVRGPLVCYAQGPQPWLVGWVCWLFFPLLGLTSHIIIQNPPLTPHGGTRGKFGVSIGLTSNMVSHVLNQKHRHNDYQNRKDVIIAKQAMMRFSRKGYTFSPFLLTIACWENSMMLIPQHFHFGPCGGYLYERTREDKND